MLKQKLIVDYLTQTFSHFFILIAGVVVARVAGPSILGVVAFGLSFASIFSFIADLGFRLAHIKLVAEGNDFGACNATYALLKLISVALFVVVALAVFFIQKSIFHVEIGGPVQEYVIFIFIAIAAITSLSGIAEGTFTAKTELVKRSLPLLIGQGLTSILKIVVVILGFGALAIALSSLFAVVIVAAVSFYFFKSYAFSRFDKELAKRYLKIAMPTLGVICFSQAMLHAGIFVFRYFANSTEVGYYTAGFKLSVFIRFAGFSFVTLFIPTMSGLMKKNNYGSISDKILKFERFSFVFIMPIVIFIAVYSRTIIGLLLGSRYLHSVNVLSISSIAMFMFLMLQPYKILLFSGGFFRSLCGALLFSLFILVISEYLLVSGRLMDLRQDGVAWAILFSNSLLFFILRFLSISHIKQIRIPFNVRWFLYGVANLAFFYFFYNYYFIHSYGAGAKILFPFLYFLFTYSSLFILRYIDRQDLVALKSAIDIKTMQSYIKKEFDDGG